MEIRKRIKPWWKADANGSLVLGGTISDTNGPWGLVKTGGYTLTLATNNIYGGDTIVSNGILAIDDDKKREKEQ